MTLIDGTRRTVVAVLAVAVISLGAADSGSSTPPATGASTCVSRGGPPDLKCTPGALNLSVKQNNIRDHMHLGLDENRAPPSTYTNKLKAQGISDYGYADKRLTSYEGDHLIPLAVGGSP